MMVWQVSLAHMRQHLIAMSSPETILADTLAGTPLLLRVWCLVLSA